MLIIKRYSITKGKKIKQTRSVNFLLKKLKRINWNVNLYLSIACSIRTRIFASLYSYNEILVERPNLINYETLRLSIVTSIRTNAD